MNKRIAFILLLGVAAVFMFGIFAFAACGIESTDSHMPGMKDCPRAIAAIAHHITAFVGAFAAFITLAVALRLAIPRVQQAFVLIFLQLKREPPRLYLRRRMDLLAFSPLSLVFSNGILHRKEAHSVIV